MALTPELEFAKALGELPRTHEQKLTAALEHLSAGQLEELLREQGLDKTAEPTPEEKLAMADQWGRDLARAYFEKTAGPGSMQKGLGMGALRLGRTGNLTAGLGGAGIGAAGGALAGAASDNEDRAGGALTGAAMGAAGGALAGIGGRYAARMAYRGEGSTGKYLRGGASARVRGPGGKAPRKKVAPVENQGQLDLPFQKQK